MSKVFIKSLLYNVILFYINKRNKTIQLNSNLGGLQFRLNSGKGEYRAVGADAWNPFSSSLVIPEINLSLNVYACQDGTGSGWGKADNNFSMKIDVRNYSTLRFTSGSCTVIGTNAGGVNASFTANANTSYDIKNYVYITFSAVQSGESWRAGGDYGGWTGGNKGSMAIRNVTIS